MERNLARSVAVSVVLMGAALSSALLVSACITPAQSRHDGLVRIAHEYNDGLRWRRYEQVTPHLLSEDVDVFMTRASHMADDFEMADHEITAIQFSEAETRAAVTVDFTWYNQRRSLVQRTVVAQDWRFQDGRWVCRKQARIKGDRFPLVPEPSSSPASPGVTVTRAP